MSPDQIAVRTRVEVLRTRVAWRTLWSKKEIEAYLAGALAAAETPEGVLVANKLFDEAQELFGRTLQTNNRNWYVGALLIGVLVCGAITLGAVRLSLEAIGSKLAAPGTIGALFVFAGMGSITSVLSRLDKLDFQEEVNRKYVIASGLARPLVAFFFACVVYIALENRLITLGGLSDTPERKEAMFWIAAFLCGFSERFAEDLLQRVIPRGGSDKDNKRGTHG
jgi:hypothetical protein